MDLETLHEAPATIVTGTGPAPAAVTLLREWSGGRCRSRLVNGGHVPVRVQEVILCTVTHALPAETPLYGEGFQMASQIGGTLGRPIDLGYYTDRGHYKIPQPMDAVTVYGLLTLSSPAAGHVLLAFTSCRWFIGRFYLRERSIDIVVDTEGLSLEPGATWDLEDFTIATGPDRRRLLTELCEGINQHHPPRRSRTVPTGWCSWYAFGPDITARIEAYRRGLAAILRGAGDSFVLGGNHPLWPSFGLLHGARSSMDIARDWDHVAHIARENLCRTWQHGRLWWNDPDVVVLTGDLSEDEFHFHATTVYATGGLLFSGDDLTGIRPDRLAMLRQLVPPTGVPAIFEDASLRVGRVPLRDRLMICLLNWDDQPQTLAFRLATPCHVRDYWTGQDLGPRDGVVTIQDMPRHSARLLDCRPLGKSLATKGCEGRKDKGGTSMEVRLIRAVVYPDDVVHSDSHREPRPRSFHKAPPSDHYTCSQSRQFRENPSTAPTGPSLGAI